MMVEGSQREVGTRCKLKGHLLLNPLEEVLRRITSTYDAGDTTIAIGTGLLYPWRDDIIDPPRSGSRDVPV